MPLLSARLRRFPLFNGVPENKLSDLSARCNAMRHPAGTLLFSAGEDAEAFYLVEAGRVKVFQPSAEGREQILHVVGEGESFAEVAVLAMPLYPASAQTLSPTLLIAIPRGPFNRLIDANPDVARTMLAGQAKWIRTLVDRTSLLVLDDVAARLSRYLIEQIQQSRLAFIDGAVFTPELTKATIANIIGTVPETLSRSFARLEKEGMLKRNGKEIVIVDADAMWRRAYPFSETAE